MSNQASIWLRPWGRPKSVREHEKAERENLRRNLRAIENSKGEQA